MIDPSTETLPSLVYAAKINLMRLLFFFQAVSKPPGARNCLCVWVRIRWIRRRASRWIFSSQRIFPCYQKPSMCSCTYPVLAAMMCFRLQEGEFFLVFLPSIHSSFFFASSVAVNINLSVNMCFHYIQTDSKDRTAIMCQVCIFVGVNMIQEIKMYVLCFHF